MLNASFITFRAERVIGIVLVTASLLSLTGCGLREYDTVTQISNNLMHPPKTEEESLIRFVNRPWKYATRRSGVPDRKSPARYAEDAPSYLRLCEIEMSKPNPDARTLEGYYSELYDGFVQTSNQSQLLPLCKRKLDWNQKLYGSPVAGTPHVKIYVKDLRFCADAYKQAGNSYDAKRLEDQARALELASNQR